MLHAIISICFNHDHWLLTTEQKVISALPFRSFPFLKVETKSLKRPGTHIDCTAVCRSLSIVASCGFQLCATIRFRIRTANAEHRITASCSSQLGPFRPVLLRAFRAARKLQPNPPPLPHDTKQSCRSSICDTVRLRLFGRTGRCIIGLPDMSSTRCKRRRGCGGTALRICEMCELPAQSLRSCS